MRSTDEGRKGSERLLSKTSVGIKEGLSHHIYDARFGAHIERVYLQFLHAAAVSMMHRSSTRIFIGRVRCLGTTRARTGGHFGLNVRKHFFIQLCLLSAVACCSLILRRFSPDTRAEYLTCSYPFRDHHQRFGEWATQEAVTGSGTWSV